MRSKKAQVAFVAVLVMILILFLIYQANNKGVGFISYLGEAQAQAVKSTIAQEHAKTYLKAATREAFKYSVNQSVIETTVAGEESPALTAALCESHCSKISNNLNKFQTSINSFASVYVPFPKISTDNNILPLVVNLPEYEMKINCNKDEVFITGLAVKQFCYDSTPTPSAPCSSANRLESCNTIKEKNNHNAQACKWSDQGTCQISTDALYNTELRDEQIDAIINSCVGKTYTLCNDATACEWQGCTDITLNPDRKCSALETHTACSAVAGCAWSREIPAQIVVQSPPSTDYQFTYRLDGYFEETLKCSEMFEA